MYVLYGALNLFLEDSGYTDTVVAQDTHLHSHIQAFNGPAYI